MSWVESMHARVGMYIKYLIMLQLSFNSFLWYTNVNLDTVILSAKHLVYNEYKPNRLCLD